MLYVGCGFCRAIVPLWCAGQFMPHMPILVVSAPMGIYCSICGLLSPFFTCTFCWTKQMLFLPGAAFPLPGVFPGSTVNIAPVVQAQPGTPNNVISGLFKELATGFTSQVGKEAASALFRMWG